MKGLSSRFPLALALVFALFSILFSGRHPVHAGSNLSDQEQNLPQATQEGPALEVVAGLSDEQVRRLLISELEQKAAAGATPEREIKGPASFLHLLLNGLSTTHVETENRLRHLYAGIPEIIPDLEHVFLRLCPIGTTQGALRNFLWVIAFLVGGLACEFLFRYFVFSKYLANAPGAESEATGNAEKVMAGLANIIPNILGLLVFFGSSYFSFMFFIGIDSLYVQLFFLSSLIAITMIRVLNILSHLIFSPSYKSFRIIPADCGAANTIHHLFVGTFSYIIITLASAAAIRRLGADIETIRLLQLGAATLLLLVTAAACVLFRKRVADMLLTSGESEEACWGKKQFASVWHVPAIAYLCILWLLLINDLADPNPNSKGAFILSFFVLPIWMVADRLAQWILLYSLKTLKIHQEVYEDIAPPTDEDLVQRRKGKELYQKLKGISRTGVILVLFIWIASLWDIRIPLLSGLAQVMFDTLVIITLAIFFWQFISSWIERKIEESIPEGEEENEADDEWGAASNRGRAYTLLPMVRKFVGSILVIMVTMTILSSMGVDIGPLLAGAGVVGLAIGFGAQKLVSDLFSGFFYLLDDAFRVGEYIEAGEVKGSVEAITLRNAMIRHHRGMLQIVPHSDLGAITNYMRGGIIVKFNLDFPYDAPIDKIRKIIKKVGQRMLQHEEYGKDFIRPVKSQGVREITNSVMTIRVKFTAQPGTHFVIRREAYRLITEALNAQGIHYAHRKVIVDLPETTVTNGLPQETKQLISQAAGAAALRSEEEKPQNTAPTTPDGM